MLISEKCVGGAHRRFSGVNESAEKEGQCILGIILQSVRNSAGVRSLVTELNKYCLDVYLHSRVHVAT